MRVVCVCDLLRATLQLHMCVNRILPRADEPVDRVIVPIFKNRGVTAPIKGHHLTKYPGADAGKTAQRDIGKARA